ncbi:CehA/McbA family metallohydrolase [Occallatibacter riparius]|uniref:CehA/McbA family metallohydrolase n=1 Tax=Occallatibacter riparius TaxID=1002689 RepID=A0A9J7BMI3_9BACT|nr:CehA/McbA family metallohydrolase [Occallatibacter riparius]UWZ82405.1 CehA/McbA family metallohydrolase [Occallatibacter riparius]
MFASVLSAQQNHPDLVLQGTVTGAQNHTYIEVPFKVPAGVHRISVDFSYTGRDQKTTLDLGIADPQRFRGNSGGNKSHFTIAESDATPSYLPGPIPAGEWKLLLSVPNIRPNVSASYRAEIRFNSAIEDSGFTTAALVTGKRWYRGDLHMHTAHSDGSCPSQSGHRVPCPVFFTAQSAAQRGLDFIAITDHNASSQYEAMRELQPYFDKLLLIPGREMTTFWGHFNIFGTTQYIDYRVQPGHDVNAVLRDARAHGAIASVNHADAPGGEICMGCAWEPQTPVDLSLLTSVEVINGGRTLLSSADMWNRYISQGARLIAISGSDNHDGPSAAPDATVIGLPMTVVEADELSVSAILDGIRKGRVFVDLTGSRDRIIDLDAQLASADPGSAPAKMGDEIHAPAGAVINFDVHVANCQRSSVQLFLDGRETPMLAPLKTELGTETLPFSWKSDGARHWLRAEVRDSNNSLVLISNPIYISPAVQ